MVNSFDILILNISDIQKFQDFQGLFLIKSVFPGLSRPANCKIKFKDFQGPVRTLLMIFDHPVCSNPNKVGHQIYHFMKGHHYIPQLKISICLHLFIFHKKKKKKSQGTEMFWSMLHPNFYTPSIFTFLLADDIHGK